MAKLVSSPDFAVILALVVVSVLAAAVFVHGEISLRRPRDINRVAIVGPYTKLFVGGAVCVASLIVAALMILKALA